MKRRIKTMMQSTKRKTLNLIIARIGPKKTIKQMTCIQLDPINIHRNI